MSAAIQSEQSIDVSADLQTIEAGRLTELRLLEMVFPEHTNHYGTLLGGRALALMDTAAFIVASRYARQTVVTASSDRVEFDLPVRLGQLVEVLARVVSTRTSSISVEVRLFAEDLLTGERRLCTHGSFVLVAIDSQGRKCALVQPASEEVRKAPHHDS